MYFSFQVGAKTSVQILRSEEGRKLRQDHKANVSYLREKLFDAGVAAQHTPSHIIPIHVSETRIFVCFTLEINLLPMRYKLL